MLRSGRPHLVFAAAALAGILPELLADIAARYAPQAPAPAVA
jgi:hypothetical protein